MTTGCRGNPNSMCSQGLGPCGCSLCQTESLRRMNEGAESLRAPVRVRLICETVSKYLILDLFVANEYSPAHAKGALCIRN